MRTINFFGSVHPALVSIRLFSFLAFSYVAWRSSYCSLVSPLLLPTVAMVRFLMALVRFDPMRGLDTRTNPC